MKIIFAFLVLALPILAQACPNFTGEYQFINEPWNGSLQITQSGCDSISIRYFGGESKRDFTVSHKLDGNAYEGLYDSKALAIETDFHSTKASFKNDRFVLNTFEGALKDCGANYSFTDMTCKLFENSFGYSNELKAYTYTQVAWFRSQNPQSYANDKFVLKKVR